MHLAAVLPATQSFDHAPRNQTIDQPDCAVVLDEQMGREATNGRRTVLFQGTDGQQKLVLLRLQPFRPRRSLAEMQKAADLVAKSG